MSSNPLSPALVAGTWRSGTRWIRRGFHKAYDKKEFWALHEPHSAGELPEGYGVAVGHTIPMIMGDVYRTRGAGPLVHLVRDPVRTAISGYRMFGPKGRGGVGIEGKMDYWYRTHLYVMRWYAHWPGPKVRLRVEDLWNLGERGLDVLAQFFGLDSNDTLREWSGNTEGQRATAEVEIPEFEIPRKVKQLASAFGYKSYEDHVPLEPNHPNWDRGDWREYTELKRFLGAPNVPPGLDK